MIMKKYIKFIALAMILSCLIAVGCVNVFAGAVQGRFYNFVPQSIGYSEANFTGNYYSLDDSRNNAIIYAASKGGEISEYTTELEIYFNGETISMDSDSEGTKTLTYNLNRPSSGFSNANAYTYHLCVSKGSGGYSWEDSYLYHWAGAQAGWTEY